MDNVPTLTNVNIVKNAHVKMNIDLPYDVSLKNKTEVLFNTSFLNIFIELIVKHL